MMGKLLYLPDAGKQASSNLAGRSEQLLLSSLIETHERLQIVRAPFNTRGDVRAVHCRKALNALERLHECIQMICQFLQESTMREKDTVSDLLSVHISSSYYQILTPLYHAQEQSSLLMASLDAHRLICFTSSQQSTQQRRTIQEQFVTLEGYLTTFFDLFQSFEVDAPPCKQG